MKWSKSVFAALVSFAGLLANYLTGDFAWAAFAAVWAATAGMFVGHVWLDEALYVARGWEKLAVERRLALEALLRAARAARGEP